MRREFAGKRMKMAHFGSNQGAVGKERRSGISNGEKTTGAWGGGEEKQPALWSGLDPAGFGLRVRGQVHAVSLCESGAEMAVGGGSEGGWLARGEDGPVRNLSGVGLRDLEMGIEELEQGVLGNYVGLVRQCDGLAGAPGDDSLADAGYAVEEVGYGKDIGEEFLGVLAEQDGWEAGCGGFCGRIDAVGLTI